MRYERIGISRRHRFRRLAKGGIDIAILAQHRLARFRSHVRRLGDEAGPTVIGAAAFVPLHFQLLARAESGPGRVGDNRHAGQQAAQIAVVAVDDEGVAHAGQRLDLVQVGADRLAAQHRAFLIGRIQHPRQLDVDAEQRLAGQERNIVDAADPGAEQFVVRRVFQQHLFRIGQRQRGGARDQRAVAQLAPAVRMQDCAVCGAALADRHVPGQRGGLNQHRARGCAQAMEIVVIGRRRSRATGALAAVDRIQVALDDAHVFPIDFQLFGQHHRQRSLDALADFRLLGNQGDHAVRGDTDECIGHEFGMVGGHDRFGDFAAGAAGDVGIQPQHQAAAGCQRLAQEAAPRQRRRNRIGHAGLPAPDYSPAARPRSTRRDPNELEDT